LVIIIIAILIFTSIIFSTFALWAIVTSEDLINQGMIEITKPETRVGLSFEIVKETNTNAIENQT